MVIDNGTLITSGRSGSRVPKIGRRKKGEIIWDREERRGTGTRRKRKRGRTGRGEGKVKGVNGQEKEAEGYGYEEAENTERGVRAGERGQIRCTVLYIYDEPKDDYNNCIKNAGESYLP